MNIVLRQLPNPSYSFKNLSFIIVRPRLDIDDSGTRSLTLSESIGNRFATPGEVLLRHSPPRLGNATAIAQSWLLVEVIKSPLKWTTTWQDDLSSFSLIAKRYPGMGRFHSVVIIVLLSLLSFTFTLVAAVNFDTCLASVRNGTFGTGRIGGTDNHGTLVDDISTATALTYPLCVQACGAGQEPFQWSVFSQQFSSWLLPWLALVSQIPFGPDDKLDNLEAVFLTVGSPTLAAYSLALTVLNGRWIARRFAPHTYPNTRNAIRVLSSLQQAPLKVVKENALLASLIVLPQNDEWWKELIEWLDYTHTWSISAVTSIAWVIIAYIFTVVDSFTGDITSSINANGQGVGSLWLWLLPIVIGWLQISPKCDTVRLTSAVERANKLAYVAADTHGPILVKHSKTEERAIELTISEDDELHRDEKCTAPLYNYARFLSWVQAVEDVSEAFRAASDHYHDHDSVDPSIDWITVERGQKPDERNRTGSKSQVDTYCKPYRRIAPRSRWGPHVFSRMGIASILALMLQWGTVGAAIIVVYFTPTIGLGCRSASYLLFGVLSTIVWMMLLVSSIFVHYASQTPLHYKGHVIQHFSTKVAEFFAIVLRRIGKFIAAFNAIWIFVSCLFQFSSFFDRCYCNSSVFGLRHQAYDVIQLVTDDVMGMKVAWIGGVCLAAGTAILFVGFVNVFIDPPLPD